MKDLAKCLKWHNEDSSLNAIENYSDLDEIEELFYSESIEDLCEIFGLTSLIDRTYAMQTYAVIYNSRNYMSLIDKVC